MNSEPTAMFDHRTKIILAFAVLGNIGFFAVIIAMIAVAAKWVLGH